MPYIDATSVPGADSQQNVHDNRGEGSSRRTRARAMRRHLQAILTFFVVLLIVISADVAYIVTHFPQSNIFDGLCDSADALQQALFVGETPIVLTGAFLSFMMTWLVIIFVVVWACAARSMLFAGGSVTGRVTPSGQEMSTTTNSAATAAPAEYEAAQTGKRIEADRPKQRQAQAPKRRLLNIRMEDDPARYAQQTIAGIRRSCRCIGSKILSQQPRVFVRKSQ